MEGSLKVVDIEINDLPDDVLLEIVSRLSRMNRKEAVRTSILSRKWRYLPSFCSSSLPMTLVLDHRDLSTRSDNSREQFTEWVNRVLKLHHDVSLEGLIIRSPFLNCRFISRYSTPRPEDIKPGDADSWVYLAMLKRVKMFELECAIEIWNSVQKYEFPDVNMMLPHLHGVKTFGFVSLSFVDVNIGDEEILYFLKTCPDLEKLRVRGSDRVNHLKIVVDDPLLTPPCLNFLEISDCNNTQSLEISVPSLISCTYGGDKVIIPFKNNPNLCALTLAGNVARSFVYEPKKHASYSDQLVKLGLNVHKLVGSKTSSQRSRHTNYNNNGESESSDPFLKIQRPDLPRLCSLKHLELNLILPVGKSIHFFIKFINGSPVLKELRIKITYIVTNPRSDEKLGFPEEAPSTNVDRVRHKNLKVVKMSGYVGCSIDDKFVLRLLNVAQSLKTVTIDTESEYYDQKPWDCATQCPKERKGPCGFCTARDVGARTRVEATRRANQLKLSFPTKTKAALIVT